MNRFVSLCTVSTLAACAANTAAERPSLDQRLTERGYARGEVVKEIQNYRVDGWNYLDDEHLVLTSGPSRYYLISLMSYCSGLSSAESIGFTDTGGRLTTFDKLRVKQPGGTNGDCQIDGIQQLTRIAKEKG